MQVFLWIIGILSGLFLLLCLTRIGGALQFGQHFVLTLRLGPVRLRFDSSAPKKPAKTRREKKPAKAKKEVTPKDLADKIPKLTLEDAKELYRTLWPIARRALSRTRRGIRLKPFRLALYLGGGDPADLAQLYGYVNAAVWTLMPQLERLLVIPEPSVHLELDFEADTTRAEGEIGIDVRIGTLLWVAVEAGIPTLRWLLRFQKTHKPAKKTKPAAPPAATSDEPNRAA